MRVVRHESSTVVEKSLPQGITKNGEGIESKALTLEAYPETFSGRLTWATMLPQSRPLHDWIIGEVGHDQRVLQSFKHPTRFEFTMDIFSRLCPVLAILLPLSKQLARNDPYFSDPTWSIFCPYGPDHSGEGKIATW
jgi:hypothetical protein